MLLRSMLFVPGSSMRMIVKAKALAADAIILDLEDAVPLSEKETARIMIRDSVKVIKSAGYYVFVRVNALSTNLTAEDLRFVCVEGLDGIMLAKTETRDDVVKLTRMLGEAEKASKLEPGSLTVVPLIESAKGVINSFKIASVSERVVAVAFGAGDYYRDLGRDVSSLSPQQTELLYARSQIVNASQAAGVQAIDTPFLGLLTDRESFMRETGSASRLGFKGKLLIHPAQIEFVNKKFSPTQDETEYARGLVQAFEQAQARGLGATSFGGKMIDYMSYKQARDLLSLIEFIAQRKKKRKCASFVSLFQFFA